MVVADPIQVALRVAEALESCGVAYLVGGSMASSITGEPRSTLDVDLVVAMTEQQVEPFITALGNEFYAEHESLVRAIRDRKSANLIHQATSTKVDLFISGGTPLDAQQMERRQRVLVMTDPERYLHVYTPEDILLQKLCWYRGGGEVSDRQWRDVLGILRVQGERIDTTYLRQNASILDVRDLLDRALEQVQH
jgi:hypothetical protein